MSQPFSALPMTFWRPNTRRGILRPDHGQDSSGYVLLLPPYALPATRMPADLISGDTRRWQFSSLARRENTVSKQEECSFHAEPEHGCDGKAGHQVNHKAETTLKVRFAQDKPVDMEDRLVSEI